MIENAVELQQLKATVSELTQKIDAAMHGHRVIDTSARAREGKLSTLAALKEALAPRIAATHARVAALQRFLSCLLGDALRAAAMCVYAGMLPSAAQLSFQREVQQALHEAGVPHTPDLALSQWMEFLEQQYTLLPQRVVMDADLQHTMYCVSLVRHHLHLKFLSCGASSNGGTVWIDHRHKGLLHVYVCLKRCAMWSIELCFR